MSWPVLVAFVPHAALRFAHLDSIAFWELAYLTMAVSYSARMEPTVWATDAFQTIPVMELCATKLKFARMELA